LSNSLLSIALYELFIWLIDLNILSCFLKPVKKAVFKFSHLSQKV